MLERFLRYSRTDTGSDPKSSTYPSTDGQLELLKMLATELKELGAEDVDMDKWGYVTATIPSTVPQSEADRIPVLGFIAHVDTSYEIDNNNVSPQVVMYRGGDLVINSEAGLVIPAAELSEYVGNTLITSDGTTLLGADDKAGVAEIMTAVEHLLKNPQIPHGKIRIAFTPDEEIGLGTEHFDVEKFGATYAYTVDGGPEGSIEYETFNAAEATVTITGVNTHPGYAKGKMINSALLAMEFQGMLPADQRPENTHDREGFFHLTAINGGTERTVMHYIIRDHDRERFKERKTMVNDFAEAINSRHAGTPVKVKVNDQYYNMREKIEPHFEVVEYALEAMRKAGVEPKIDIVRGGTDGSRLSFMGLPCPNLFTGAENIHSRKEFVSLEVMHKAVSTIVNICELFSKKALQNK